MQSVVEEKRAIEYERSVWRVLLGCLPKVFREAADSENAESRLLLGELEVAKASGSA